MDPAFAGMTKTGEIGAYENPIRIKKRFTFPSISHDAWL